MRILPRLWRVSTRSVILSFTIVLILMFAIYMLTERAFWFDFLSNTLATFVGVIVGIPVAILLSELQERQSEKERKQKILQLVTKELLTNSDELKQWKSSDNRQNDGLFLHTLLKTEVWRAFSDGGELEWIKSPDLLGIISEAYFSIRATRTLSERYFEVKTMMTTGIGEWAEKTLISKIEESVFAAEKTLETALKTINEELRTN